MGRLKAPEGFGVNVFARDLGKPRMLAVGDDGTVYVTRRDPGDVLALRDRAGKVQADAIDKVLTLRDAHGITLHRGQMYVCTVKELYVAELKDGKPGEPRKLLDDLPPGGRHPNRTLAFGPDDLLYISVGSTCNCCQEKSRESATVLRARPDGSQRKVFTSGLRNTIGFGWHPKTRQLWGMDHGNSEQPCSPGTFTAMSSNAFVSRESC
jgi:glucose/arabinose dehydrogenase